MNRTPLSRWFALMAGLVMMPAADAHAGDRMVGEATDAALATIGEIEADDAALTPGMSAEWWAQAQDGIGRPRLHVEADQFHARLGWSVGTAGDVNADGYADVIVGAINYGDGGKVFVHHGSAWGLSKTPDWMAESDQADAEFGGSVGTAGDVNGDGYDDVVVGAPNYDEGSTGRAFVYQGSASGLSATADWIAPYRFGAYFGFDVGTAGDVNGDGYDDGIVGAPLFSHGEEQEGAAVLFRGRATPTPR